METPLLPNFVVEAMTWFDTWKSANQSNIHEIDYDDLVEHATQLFRAVSEVIKIGITLPATMGTR